MHWPDRYLPSRHISFLPRYWSWKIHSTWSAEQLALSTWTLIRLFLTKDTGLLSLSWPLRCSVYQRHPQWGAELISIDCAIKHTSPTHSTFIHTCSWGFGHSSSLGMVNKKPDSASSESLLETFKQSPSWTPVHQEWLKITQCDSFTSWTHACRIFVSPGLRGETVGKALYEDCAVFDRLRENCDCSLEATIG